MVKPSADSINYWDSTTVARGHTGYSESFLYNYDQPIRLTTISKIIDSYFLQPFSSLSVLDVGCGKGDFIDLYVHKQFGSILGLDISNKVLEKSALRFREADNVLLRLGSIVNTISTESDRFDLITSITVLQHHTKDDELISALSILATTLRPGGIFIALELSNQGSNDMQFYSQSYNYLTIRSHKTWLALFEKAGFKLLSQPVMPQLGIYCLRLLSNFTSTFYNPSPSSSTASNSLVIPTKKSFPIRFLRRFLGIVYHLSRRSILLICYIFDHFFRLPLPGFKHRTYEVFVLSKL